MLRKAVFAGFVLAVTFSLAAAEEFRAIITKVEGSKVSFVRFKKGDDGKFEKGPEMTLPTASDLKVVNAKFNKDTKKVEPGDALENGLKNERFKDIGEKGVGATIVTDDDGKTIREIRIGGFGKGFKKKDV